MICGFLVVDKPVGLTSHDVVAIIRSTTGIRKIGHTGTLDPFATGVLPLAIGRATRLIQYLDEDLKIYVATVLLGVSTDTGDPTGEVREEKPVPELDEDRVRGVLDGMQGVRMQTPPMYSAVKVNGKRLYRYAREGKEVQVEARPIRIDSIELLEFAPPRLRIRIQCGRGTYARVLAEEIAAELGTVGHLESLRRSQSGHFIEAGALSMSEHAEIVAGTSDWKNALRPARGEERVPWNPRDSVQGAIRERVLSPNRALFHLPELQIPEPLVRRLIQSGQLADIRPALPVDSLFRACSGDEMVALMRMESRGPRVLRMLAQLSD